MNLSLVIFSLVFILSLSIINVIALLALYSDHRHKDRTHLNGLLSTIILLVGVAGRQLITILRMSGLGSKYLIIFLSLLFDSWN